MSTHSHLPQPEVSILIVAYNSADLIEKCITSIKRACLRSSYEVLMIDNGDGKTQALVAERFPDVKLVPSQGNVGFAAGNNLLAREAHGRFLLLLNPDVELKADAVDLLLDAASQYPSAAAWGGVTLDAAGNPDVGNTVHVPSLREMGSRVVGRSSAGRNGQTGFDRDVKVPVLSGSFFLIQRDLWEAVGGLDARYFLYCEEVDLFYRLAKRGYVFWRIAAARGTHFIGHGEAMSEMRLLYRAAGVMQFVRLHWSVPRQMLAFILQWLGAWQRVFLGALVGRWSEHFRLVGQSNRALALRPNHWRFGYDKKRGLLSRLTEK